MVVGGAGDMWVCGCLAVGGAGAGAVLGLCGYVVAVWLFGCCVSVDVWMGLCGWCCLAGAGVWLVLCGCVDGAVAVWLVVVLSRCGCGCLDDVDGVWVKLWLSGCSCGCLGEAVDIWVKVVLSGC